MADLHGDNGSAMKILSITYTDQFSGAGIAAIRLHRALLDAGVDSTMAVMAKRSDLEDVVPLGTMPTFAACAVRQFLSKQLLRAAGCIKGETLSTNLFPSGLHRVINRIAPDLVHLHWIGGETIQIEEIARIEAPIVWTLHDEWPAIGMEHYRTFPDRRGVPPVASPRRSWLFRRMDSYVRARKQICWQKAKPSFVAPSRWLTALAQQELPSGLRPVRTIPNTVPLDIFRPISKSEARYKLGLPAEARLIAFGAINSTGDSRKGYAVLRAALKLFAERLGENSATLLLFGNRMGHEEAIEGLPCRFYGVTNDTSQLALLYAAADVFVCPSLQENLPNTVAEALSCGTPCVGFAIGGLPDLIDHGRNGYLARPFDAADLALGIETVVAMPDSARVRARAKAEMLLDGKQVAASYLQLYREILGLIGLDAAANNEAGHDCIATGVSALEKAPP
jgi:glycosyltransferase involved in cell wall biosynthesis